MSAIEPAAAEHLLQYVRKFAPRTDVSPAFVERVEKAIQVAGGLDPTLPDEELQRPVYFYLPGLTARPFWDASQFDWVPRLEAAYETIKNELMQLRSDTAAFGPHPQADLVGAGTWAEYHFFEAEKKFEENCARCPETTAIIESIGAAQSCALKYFSALAPATRVRPHCGPYNLRLRCHLGLVIPDHCGMRVGVEVRTWHEGKCLVFDDSFFHESWNESDRTRIVLLLDFIHPELASREVGFLRKLWNEVQRMQDDSYNNWRVNQIRKHERISLPQRWWV